MTTPIATGFIIHDDTAIWGRGATAEAAWADMLSEMKMAGIRVLADDDEPVDDLEATTPASGFKTKPATAALLAQIDGGDPQRWGEVAGVACTRSEEDDA
jgi:hypothetical protein